MVDVLWFAVVQIVCGCLFFIAELVLGFRDPSYQPNTSPAYRLNFYLTTGYTLVRFWPGVFYIVTGSFGIASTCENTALLMLASLMLNLLSCTCVSITIMADYGRRIDEVRINHRSTLSSDPDWELYPFLVFSTLLVLSVIQMVLSLTSAVYIGKAVFHKSKQSALFSGQPQHFNLGSEVQYERHSTSDGPETAVVQAGDVDVRRPSAEINREVSEFDVDVSMNDVKNPKGKGKGHVEFNMSKFSSLKGSAGFKTLSEEAEIDAILSIKGYPATDRFNESNLAASSSAAYTADYTGTLQPDAGNHNSNENNSNENLK